MSRQRQINKKEEIKQLILNTAREIMVEEGIDKISIRKITNTLDYSPGIVYHYFKDKDEITEILLKEGYGEILNSLRDVKDHGNEPEKEIRARFISYINAVLKFSEYYLAIVLSDKASILQYTSILHKGVSEDRKSIKILCDSIRKGIQLNQFKECNVELTAQALWVSIFGLTVRLIIEGEIDIEQKEKLINQQLDILISGIKK
ncbi:TetR/AcrR family transcriptional regulator [Vallitalea guaymasensis]|uniref:TetR/AcrR family transcriptional regulator n=1 Tax=Vallitalea guaymasensis TaxID=1185412 RepID=A0A8J8SAL2_9FIRM|nr:TetR/AcrR family transcriptional regulator [Vallitalea guaymasensis]QUH27848.1 TetR/AcrR family transcriptional regulator [Vallitalea guaymasensis]